MTSILDCVCLIHGDRYDWRYVENLYAMLTSHMPADIRLHVFTEPSRSVPDHMIKHELQEWPEISNTRRAWWYKMQIFDPSHGLGQVLYLDLDMVICGSLGWVLDLDTQYFWAIHDWRRLWRPQWQGINSSMMYWNLGSWPQPWAQFRDLGLTEAVKRYHGDQDLLTAVLPKHAIQYFPDHAVRSWRWQIHDSGMDPRTRRYAAPNTGSVITPGTSVMVFHGRPKPHEVDDAIIRNLWPRSQSTN
jgi:hypothetical protein